MLWHAHQGKVFVCFVTRRTVKYSYFDNVISYLELNHKTQRSNLGSVRINLIEINMTCPFN